jgi:hypothetical protein
MLDIRIWGEGWNQDVKEVEKVNEVKDPRMIVIEIFWWAEREEQSNILRILKEVRR